MPPSQITRIWFQEPTWSKEINSFHILLSSLLMCMRLPLHACVRVCVRACEPVYILLFTNGCILGWISIFRPLLIWYHVRIVIHKALVFSNSSIWLTKGWGLEVGNNGFNDISIYIFSQMVTILSCKTWSVSSLYWVPNSFMNHFFLHKFAWII